MQRWVSSFLHRAACIFFLANIEPLDHKELLVCYLTCSTTLCRSGPRRCRFRKSTRRPPSRCRAKTVTYRSPCLPTQQVARAGRYQDGRTGCPRTRTFLSVTTRKRRNTKRTRTRLGKKEVTNFFCWTHQPTRARLSSRHFWQPGVWQLVFWHLLRDHDPDPL